MEEIFRKAMKSKRADIWSLPAVPIGVCAYEVIAMYVKSSPFGKYMPTLTTLMHRYPVIKPVFVGTLAFHLLNEKE